MPVRHALNAILVLFFSWITAESIGYALNTAKYKPDWVLGKRLLDVGVLGSWSAKTTQNLFSQNTLNLEVWHGFQELLYYRPVEFREFRAELSVEPDAYVDVLLSKSAATSAWIRLSHANTHHNQYFETDSTGEGIFSQRLTLKFPKSDFFEFVVRKKGNSIDIEVNNNLQESFERPIHLGLVGFRGSQQPATVDSLFVSSGAGADFIFEDFRQSRIVLLFFMIIAVPLLIILGVPTACLAILSHRVTFPPKIAQARKRIAIFSNIITLFLVNSIVIVGTLFLFDYYRLSLLYPVDYHKWQKVNKSEYQRFVEYRRLTVETLANWYETLRPSVTVARNGAVGSVRKFLELPLNKERPTNTDFQIARGDINPAIPLVDDSASSLQTYFNEHPLPSTAETIVLLGTSQTWGSGALRMQEQITFQLYEELRQALETQSELQNDVAVLNIARFGYTAKKLIEVYEKVLPYIGTHLLVVILGNNDPDVEQLDTSVQELLRLHQLNGGGRVIVIEEPVDRPYKKLLRNHQRLAEIADSQNALLLKMADYMLTPEVVNSGHLWWDNVHLTSYGQKLFVKQLAAKILELLETATNDPSSLKPPQK